MHRLAKRLHNSYYPLIGILLISSMVIGFFNFIFVETRQAEADKLFLEGPPPPPIMTIYAYELETVQKLLVGVGDEIKRLHDIDIRWQEYLDETVLADNSIIIDFHAGDLSLMSTLDENHQNNEDSNESTTTYKLCNQWLFPAVHFDNFVNNISLDQYKKIYHGEINNWSQVGGWNEPIEAFLPDSSVSPVVNHLFDKNSLPESIQFYKDFNLIEDRLHTSRPTLSLVPAKSLKGSIGHLSIDGIAPLKKTGPIDDYALASWLIVKEQLGNENPYYQLFLQAFDWQLKNQKNFPSNGVCFNDLISLNFVGDMMLSRWVGHKSLNIYKNPLSPFEKTVDFLKEADFTIGNLEAPFDDDGRMVTDGMVFKIEPNMMEGLKYAGFDVLDLANNHFGDQGRDGMNYTMSYLENNGIEYYGAGSSYNEAHEALVLNYQGFKIGLLGYCDIPPFSYAAGDDYPGYALLDEQNLIRDIQEAKKKVTSL